MSIAAKIIGILSGVFGIGRSGVTTVLGAAANPADANADFIWTPSAAAKTFVFDTTSTQPVIVRQLGGVVGTGELQISQLAGGSLLEDKSGGTLTLKTSGLNWIVSGGTTADVNFPNGNVLIQNDNKALYFGGGSDTLLSRIVAGVLGVNGWFQNTAGCLVLNADATNITNTLASSNITFALKAGRTYSIKAKITGSNSTATEGFKLALTADGTLTATRFDLSVVGVIGTVVAGTQRVTSLGTAITFTTFTSPSDAYLVGEIKVNVAGVLTLQFAETSAHVAGTATLSAGSWVELQDCVAV